MNSKKTWSRRAFLQSIGYTSGLGLLNKSFLRASQVSSGVSAMVSVEFAYVVSREDVSAGSQIHVFEVRGNDWNWRQSVPSRSPVSLAFHPSLPVLYVANEVDEHELLPRGAVEAYRIEPNDGSLVLMSRQPLSLSGIKPRHIAVSPDGGHLVVAIHGGGAYNVLPIGSDGAITCVSQILKEVGSGTQLEYQSSAHPHTVGFLAGEHLLATDEGCDRINVFTFRSGRMQHSSRISVAPGARPGHFVMHPSDKFLYISNTLDRSIDCYSLRAELREIKHEQRVPGLGKRLVGGDPLVLSPTGKILYAAFADQGISVFRVDPVTGRLSRMQRWSARDRTLSSPILSSDSRRIVALDDSQQELLSIPIHEESGELGHASVVAKVSVPVCLMMRSGASS